MWFETRLSDIAIFNPRETLKKGEVAKKIAMEQLQPFCRDVSSFDFAPFNGGMKFRNGDTIMARITPCLENGKLAKVNVLNEDEVGFGSTEYIVLRAREGTDEDFLYYLVYSSYVRSAAIKSMVGSSGRQRVQMDVLENLPILVPSYSDQQKIGRTLKRIDDKIALNQCINKNLEEQAQVIFDMEFVEKNKSDNKNQKGWRNACLSDIAQTIVCGKTPSTKKPDYYGEDMPFITIPDMYNSVYITKTTRRLSMLGINSQKNKILPSNSVCVSCIGTAGLVSLVAEPSQTNQQINTIIPLEDISSYFIFFLLKSLSNKIQNLGASGSTIPNLNKSQFSEIEIMIPPKTLLEEFDSIVAPFFNAILEHQYQIEYLSILRDTLLPRLMSGELDVSNIEL